MRPPAGEDAAANGITELGAGQQQIDTRTGAGAMGFRTDSPDDRFDLDLPLRIVRSVLDRQLGEAGQRCEPEGAAREPEEVICSCQVHAGLQNRGAFG